MTFNTLEQRFNATVNKLYAGAKNKFADGKPTTNILAQPYLTRKPGDGQFGIKLESRSAPVVSSVQDVKRLTLFQFSGKGIVFLAKQQYLQTGNTFESARIINPTFILGNAVPFVHVKRSANIPITARSIGSQLLGGGALANSIFGGGKLNTGTVSSTNRGDLRRIAQLQEETYNKFSEKAEASSFKKLFKSVSGRIPLIGTLKSAVRAKRSVGDVSDGDYKTVYLTSRPELANSTASTFNLIPGVNLSVNVGRTSPISVSLGGSSSGYVMLQHYLNLAIQQNNQTIKYKPRYFPTTNNTYKTYLRSTNDKATWSPIGQTGRDYKTSENLLKYNRFFNFNAFRLAANSDLLKLYKKETDFEKIIDKKSNLPYTKLNTLDYQNTFGFIARYNKKPSEARYAMLQVEQNEVFPSYPYRLAVSSSISKKYKETKTEEVVKNIPIINKDSDKQRFLLEKAFILSDGTVDPFTRIESRVDGDPYTSLSEQIQNNAAPKFLAYFTADDQSIRTQDQLSSSGHGKVNAKTLALDGNGNRIVVANPNVKISYIRDPSNSESSQARRDSQKVQEPYRALNSDFTDIINVSFAMGRDSAIKFRAFVKDLTQTATPQYNQYQYIGRIEKFISYTTVQREISFKLSIVAYGKSELNAVWARINYLTGMAFPYGANKGLFQPNIVRLTIGDVYVNQPGYLQALDTNFSELTETWEIGKGQQVPIAATMNIRFVLIEKSGLRTASSPFYGITEQNNAFSTTPPTNQLPLPAQVPQTPPQTPPTPPETKPEVTQGPIRVPAEPTTRSLLVVNPKSSQLDAFDAEDIRLTQQINLATRRARISTSSNDRQVAQNLTEQRDRRREEVRTGFRVIPARLNLFPTGDEVGSLSARRSVASLVRPPSALPRSPIPGLGR